MFAEMRDVMARRAAPGAAKGLRPADAEVAIERFLGRSADLRGAAVLGGDGGFLAASGAAERWGRAAAGLLAAADAAAGARASHAHVATEEGEVYAVRAGALAMVAVTERFTLASLVLSDMRATLRGLAAREAA